ncbi:MAG TPA: pyruvate ferredoxin oxidoreductase, partial [Thermoplasmatales archaeon]|nr:pyruvate ferredoxin oxidoreductase [Thermoplasmatales archaeon]
TARAAVDSMREKGMKVGTAKLTVFRPFPFDDIKSLSKKAKVLAVVDRDISFGFGGAVFAEVSGALVNEREKPIIMGFILGLGGRDITQDDFFTMADKAKKAMETGNAEMVTWINLKEVK